MKATLTRFALLLIVVTLSDPTYSFAQILNTQLVQIESAVLGRMVPVYVCIPSDYGTSPGRRYAVVYDFPGGDGRTSNQCAGWSSWIELMDMDPFIVVSVEGHVGRLNGWSANTGLWTNSPVSGRWEDWVMDEVVPFMDAAYRTVADPQHRIAHGGSGGGYPAAYYPLKRPDIFGNGVTQVGVSHFMEVCDTSANPYTTKAFRDQVLSENPGPPYNYSPSAGLYTEAMFNFAAAWSPNMNNQPWMVDLPFDINGDPVREVCDRWLEYSPAAMVSKVAPEYSLYFNFGLWTRDVIGPFAEMTMVLMDSLNAYSIPYETFSAPCGHGVSCPDGDDHTLNRFRLWFANNLIRNGSLSISRAPAPVVVPKKSLYTYGDVQSLPGNTTVRLYNYGPGEAVVSLTTDNPFFIPTPAQVTIADRTWEDVSVDFIPTTGGWSTTKLTLDHDGVGIKSVRLRARAPQGTATETLPDFVEKFDVYPSPTSGRTRVSVDLSAGQAIEATVYDMLGRRVASLVQSTFLAPGNHDFAWIPENNPPGVYFVRVVTPRGITTRSVILMK
jgi:Putative esterase